MNQRIKILYIITQGAWGGAQRYVFDLATNLGEEFEIFVAVGEQDGPQDNLSDEEVMEVIRKEIKKRTDAFDQFIAVGRQELADLEAKEKEVLMKFMPAQMSLEELTKKVNELLDKEVIDPKMVGKYVGLANKAFRDVADGKSIKDAVEAFIKNK
jgi:uncharacterized protein YqeY